MSCAQTAGGRRASREKLSVILVAVMATATAVSAGVGPGAEVALAAGTTYYVNCGSGKDNNSGRSQSNAWRTIGRANEADLKPGDSLLFKRGCSWNGPLMVTWNGTSGNRILISAYGSGDRPMIRNAPNANVKISGSYLVIENLQTRTDTNQYALDGSCKNQPVGWKLGFQLDGPAHHNTIRNTRTSNHAMGFGMSDQAHHNVVTGNEIRNNIALWSNQPGNPLGGLGLNLHGNANEVSWNVFSGNKALCGKESNGSISQYRSSISIEMFQATNSKVHHNVSYDRIFVEMGSSAQITSADNTFAYNVHSSAEKRSRFAVTRGNGETYGPVMRTSLYNNVVYHTGGDSQGVVCSSCSPNMLTMKNNIIAVKTKALYISSGNWINESNNIYWPIGGLPVPNNFIQNWNIAPTSKVANPRFVNAPGRNFHVQSNSPAINRGSGEAVGQGYTQDLDRQPVPAGQAADIGVDERPGG